MPLIGFFKKKNKGPKIDCPFGHLKYNENCKLINCDMKENCPVKNNEMSHHRTEQVGISEFESSSGNIKSDFYKKPGVFQVDINTSRKNDEYNNDNSLKCSYCGRRFLKTRSVNSSKCHRCGKIFCPEHHLPSNHRCKGSILDRLFRRN